LYRNFELDLNQIDLALPKVEMPDEKSALEVFNARIFREFQELMPVEMVKDQLDTFFREDQQAIQIISKAIDSQARDVIVESAHTLKGVCWLLGLTAMANTLAAIEKGGLDLSMELLDGLLTQFQDDIDQTRDILNSALLLH
jgi:HPt (histidine-containing phosphotransfer) domain-containing protein